MRQIVLGAFIAVSLVASARAEIIPPTHEELKLYYPSLQEIYEDCKSSLKMSETDMPGFLRSACARQLNGIFNGYYQVLARLQFVNEPNDSCSSVKNKIYNELQNVICFPEGLLKQIPELNMAKDLVAYIEESSEKDKSFFDKYSFPNSFFAIGMIVNEMYKCSKEPKKNTK